MDLKMWLIFSALMLLGGVVTQVQEINQRCFPFDQAKMSAQEGNEDRQVEAVQTAAADLGIVTDDFSSITELAFGCCHCTFKCWIQGGICLPSWLELFFPNFNDQICSPQHRCSCFLRPKEDYCPCNKPCGNGGTCKSGCSSLEIREESSVCSEFSDCQCCVDCNTKTCNGGQCRKTCAWNQYSEGNCPGSNCQCCKTCSGTCGNNRYCRKTCYSSETQVGNCKSEHCRCCEKIGCEGSCNGGECRKACLENESAVGTCSGSLNCKCCRPKFVEGCERSCNGGECRKTCFSNEYFLGTCSGSLNCKCCRPIYVARPVPIEAPSSLFKINAAGKKK